MNYNLHVDSIDPIPASLTDLFREHARIDTTVDAKTVAQYVATAVSAIEDDIRGYLRGATIIETFDFFPLSHGRLLWTLNRAPVAAVDTIKYVDTDGAEQTWDAANYETDLKALPPRIWLAEGGTVPSLQHSPSNCSVTYTCAAPADMSQAQQAILERATAYYEERLPTDRESMVYQKAIRNLTWHW